MRREKNFLQSIYEGKKNPAHQVARKKTCWPEITHLLPPPTPSRVKWLASYKNRSQHSLPPILLLGVLLQKNVHVWKILFQKQQYPTHLVDSNISPFLTSVTNTTDRKTHTNSSVDSTTIAPSFKDQKSADTEDNYEIWAIALEKLHTVACIHE